MLELKLPQAMSEIVDVGIANGDRSYILLTGLKMFLMAIAALLCGVANSLLPRVIRFLLHNKGAESIYIAPEFRLGAAWVYMEGIIGLNLAKLIGIIGKEVTRYGTYQTSSLMKY